MCVKEIVLFILSLGQSTGQKVSLKQGMVSKVTLEKYIIAKVLVCIWTKEQRLSKSLSM